MEIELGDKAEQWRQKAGEFVRGELIPWEIEAEMNAGELPPEISERHHRMAIELGFSSMDVP